MPNSMRVLTALLSTLGFVAHLLAQTPWERYATIPTSENARGVTLLEYSSKNPDFADEVRRTEEDVMLLEVQVLSSDTEAVDLAFRLREKADGHIAEMLDEMLGRLIRINPRLFLQSLLRHRSVLTDGAGLVGNFGYPFVDREQAQGYERDLRVAALLTVKEPALLRLRDECVGLLHDLKF